MSGASATIASVMPCTSVEAGGIERPGLTSVSKTSLDEAAVDHADGGDLHDLVARIGQKAGGFGVEHHAGQLFQPRAHDAAVARAGQEVEIIDDGARHRRRAAMGAARLAQRQAQAGAALGQRFGPAFGAVGIKDGAPGHIGQPDLKRGGKPSVQLPHRQGGALPAKVDHRARALFGDGQGEIARDPRLCDLGRQIGQQRHQPERIAAQDQRRRLRHKRQPRRLDPGADRRRPGRPRGSATAAPSRCGWHHSGRPDR